MVNTDESFRLTSADEVSEVNRRAGLALRQPTENNLVTITDAANHATGFTYDALGRVTQVTFPSTLTESYTYDALNNLLTKTDRKGVRCQGSGRLAHSEPSYAI